MQSNVQFDESCHHSLLDLPLLLLLSLQLEAHDEHGHRTAQDVLRQGLPRAGFDPSTEGDESGRCVSDPRDSRTTRWRQGSRNIRFFLFFLFFFFFFFFFFFIFFFIFIFLTFLLFFFIILFLLLSLLLFFPLALLLRFLLVRRHLQPPLRSELKRLRFRLIRPAPDLRIRVDGAHQWPDGAVRRQIVAQDGDGSLSRAHQGESHRVRQTQRLIEEGVEKR
mmetsp:Transcript_21284/g.38045  ORF Transcript_21284/g.38045 Transcript_21284/m.38045 type:complete len:221 (+) Transcript_21284:233-895(+)